MQKISICTVCMNRLNHLKQTLPVNLAQNISHPNFEYVLLDYNSTDGMEQWVNRNMMLYINKGILKYYRTDEPAYWRMNHARNMASLLATGDIVCLVDADNYAGKNYVHWVHSMFEKFGPNIIVTASRDLNVKQNGQAGKIAYNKSDFNAIRGFDEAFTDYGMDEIDFIKRLTLTGVESKLIDRDEFIMCIAHPHEDRIRNGYLMKHLAGIYVLTNEELTSLDIIYTRDRHYVLYLLKDNTFLKIVYELCEEERKMNYFTGGFNINREKSEKGTYNMVPGGICLQVEGEEPVVYDHKKEGVFINAGHNLHPVLNHIPATGNERLFETLVIAYSDGNNRLKYEDNLKKRTVINEEGWGKGTVYLNFDRTNPIAAGVQYSFH